MQDYYTSDDVVNLNKINFRIAFTVEGYLDQKRKDDPRFVKYLIRVYGKKEGKAFERLVPYHECTVEDFNRFDPLDDKN